MSDPAPARRRSRPRTLAELVPRCLGETLAAKGFAGTELLTRWSEIAGPELAAHSRPLEVKWPRRRGGAAAEPATLVVGVDGAFALDLQQQAPVLIERINAYLGWAGIGRIRIKQGTVARSGSPRRVPPDAALDPATEDALAARVAGVADPRLAEALFRLGRAVVSGQ